ncbi:MAG: hypothetical protein WCJ56_10990 [bacterium]
MIKQILLAVMILVLAGTWMYAQTPTATANIPVELTSWLIADEINVAQHGTLSEFTATGNVQIILPEMTLTASSFHGSYDSTSKKVIEGNAENIDARYSVYNPEMFITPINFHLRAKNIIFKKGENPYMMDAEITTCDEIKPHYHLEMRSGDITETGLIQAKTVSFYLGNTRLVTLPYLKGSLFSKDDNGTLPSIGFGYNPDDGPYLQAKMRMTVIDDGNTLQIATKIGTEKQLRAAISLAHVIALPNNGTGTFTLSATRNEDISANIPELNDISNTALRDVTLNREPAFKLVVSPLSLGNAIPGTTFRLGGSMGRYREEPADISGSRMQAWGIIGSPVYNIGDLRAHVDLGYQVAKYSGGDNHTVAATMVTVETDPRISLAYGNLSYIQRNEGGSTPYQFDRVQVPRELYSEFEYPISKDRCTKLAVWNRFDLDSERFRSVNITATYNLDCIAYGVTYDVASKSFGVGFKLNFLDTFRKGGIGRLNFAQ